MIVIVRIHNELSAAWLWYIAYSILYIFVPPSFLPVGVVYFTAALQLVLYKVEVLCHARVIGLTIGFKSVIKEFSNVNSGIVTIEKY